MDNTIRLKDACKILNGFAFKSSKYVDSGIRIIRIANVQKGYVEDEKPAFYPDSEEPLIRDYMLEENDLLLSLTGNVGRVALLDKKWLPAALNQRVACLRIKDDRIIKDYLYFALLSDKFENDCIKSSKGIAQKNMSTEWLKDYEIPLPSEQRQREIVSSLKHLSAIIKNKTEQIRQLDNLIKARFVEMFGNVVANDKGWPTEPISKAAPTSSPKIKNNETVWLLNLDMVESQSGKVISKLIVSEDKINASTCTFDENNVLYSKLRPYLNKVVLPDQEGYCTTELVPLKPGKELTREFLATLLRSDAFVGYINEKTAGAKMPRVSMNIFRQFECILPPIALQQQFSEFYNQVDKSKFAVQKSLEKTQQLFDSLMQEYFG